MNFWTIFFIQWGILWLVEWLILNYHTNSGDCFLTWCGQDKFYNFGIASFFSLLSLPGLIVILIANKDSLFHGSGKQ